MRVVVKSKEENTNININIPMIVIIILLRVCKPFIRIDFDKNFKISIANSMFKNREVDIIIKGLKYLNKEHKGLYLIDIEESNGYIVKIQV